MSTPHRSDPTSAAADPEHVDPDPDHVDPDPDHVDPDGADPDRVDPAVWRMAITFIVGALAVVFDTTIVSVALNDLAKELDAPLSTIQWVSTGYLLAVFVTIPLAGWAQSRLGGRHLWIAALGGFLLGSILSALAWDATALIAFRIVQGVAGGLMMPLMATLLMQAARGRNIGKVMAIITVPTALGPILGPVLGGLILHLADWRWLFFVNIPFCVVGGWLARRNLPDDRPAPDRPRARLDVVGLLLLCPGFAALVYGLSQVEGSAGFPDAKALVPLIGGLVLVGGFAAWALTRTTGALVNVRLFRHRAVASSSTLLLLGGISLYGSMMLLPLYFQQVRGEDALGAGLLLIPQGVGALLARGLAGAYTDRIGPRGVAFAAFAFVAVSTVPFAFVTAETSEVLLMAALFVRGLALGAAMIAPMGAAYVGLEHGEIPDASIITRSPSSSAAPWASPSSPSSSSTAPVTPTPWAPWPTASEPPSGGRWPSPPSPSRCACSCPASPNRRPPTTPMRSDDRVASFPLLTPVLAGR